MRLEAAVGLALLLPCGAGAQESVPAAYKSVGVVVTVGWGHTIMGLDSALVVSRLRTVFELELRRDGVPVSAAGGAPSLELGVVGVPVTSGGMQRGIAYAYEAQLVGLVLTPDAAASYQDTIYRKLGSALGAGYSAALGDLRPCKGNPLVCPFDASHNAVIALYDSVGIVSLKLLGDRTWLLDNSFYGVVWRSGIGIRIAGSRADVLTALEASARDAAEDFANAWLATHKH